MLDQLKTTTKSSYDDYEASIKSRKIGKPKKKTIKETVPFSNTAYDFSDINGEIYWEERELEYVFEITADSVEKLEEKKIAFASWVMNIKEEHLYDPFIKDYYFKATFDSIDEDDSEIEKSTITVKFTAYPYMFAINNRVYSYPLEKGVQKIVYIDNNSSHRVTATITTNTSVTIRNMGVNYAVPEGITKDDSFKIAAGSSALFITPEDDGLLDLQFREEVF